ncbi:hypothetical protein D9613_007359 [Agrocybe pediades]|uniref:Uncharacterized protein n=1 Tax=Agrocybe pediades TaxID=84607 RepID=A0A8H4QMB8_9AGAR|nr:hypothetical protein D9613_007359 [Agrocybe pediades]
MAHGVEPSILSTILILGSRFQIIVLVAFVYIVSHLVSLGMKVIAYLGHTFLGTKLKRPILRIFDLLHIILSNTFGDDYLLLAEDYFKAFPGYALHQSEKRLYKPWKDKIVKMKKSSSFAAFVYRRVLELIAFPVFTLSVTCAFVFVYATVGMHSAPSVCVDDAEEVSTTVCSSMPSTDTASTAVDTSPSENARSTLEITESEDTAAAVGLFNEMKSSLEEAQHSSEAIENEVLRGAVVDDDLVLQEVTVEKVADEEAPIQDMVEEKLVDELSEAEEPVDDAVPCVDEYEEVVAEVDIVAEAEVVDTAVAEVPEVLEEDALSYVAESSADVTDQTVLGEEEDEELEEEVESLDVEEDVEEVSGEIEEGIEEVEEAEDEVDGEVDYAEETGFSEEVSGEAEEEEYEQVEEEVSGEVEEPGEESGEAEEEVEYAEEDEQEKSEEVEEVFEYDEEPRRVEPDLYVPRDDAEYPIDEPQQEEEDPNAVEVNLSAESLVSATIDHANMGLVTTIETECVLINIVASSTEASLEREAGELEEEVEAEKEEDNDEQDQSEASAIAEAEEPEREVEGSKMNAWKEEASVRVEGLEAEAEKERLHKQRVREIARKMAKGGVLSAEEKAILLSSYSRKKDSTAETKSAQFEVNGGVSSAANRVTSDVEGVNGGDEAVSTRPASTSPNASMEETVQGVEAELAVSSADVHVEVQHINAVEAEAEVKDDEPERPELMQVKSPWVEFRSRALSLDAIVGMEALSFSSLALGGVSNAFAIPTGSTNGASGSLSRRTLSLGE